MTVVALSEAIRAVTGRAGVDPTARVYSVTKHRGFVPSDEYFSKQVFSKDLSTYKVVEQGQFAYATIHLDEGSVGYAPETCLVSPMYTVFETDQSRVDNDYLFRLLRSPKMLQAYSSIGRGSAERRRSISLEALGTLKIPLPPLPEQRRIASILDQVDQLRLLRRQTLEKLRSQSESEFRAVVVRGRGEDWPTVKLGDVADLQGGLQVSKSREVHPVTVPYLRVANVYRSSLTLSEVKSMQVTEAEFARVRLLEGDILLVEGHGNPLEVGRAARWSGSLAGVVHQNHLIRARVHEDRLNSRYLEAVLNSPTVVTHWRRVAKTTSGLNTINMANVRGVPVLLPPLEIQQSLAARIDDVANLKQMQIEHLARLDELFASLEHRAFRGEL